MKTCIFVTKDEGMAAFVEIVAATPAEAIRTLVQQHGLQPYSLANIIPEKA